MTPTPKPRPAFELNEPEVLAQLPALAGFGDSRA